MLKSLIEGPYLCPPFRSTFAVRQTASLGQQMLNETVGINGCSTTVGHHYAEGRLFLGQTTYIFSVWIEQAKKQISLIIKITMSFFFAHLHSHILSIVTFLHISIVWIEEAKKQISLIIKNNHVFFSAKFAVKSLGSI